MTLYRRDGILAEYLYDSEIYRKRKEEKVKSRSKSQIKQSGNVGGNRRRSKQKGLLGHDRDTNPELSARSPPPLYYFLLFIAPISSLSLYLLIKQLRRGGAAKEDPRFSNGLSLPAGIIHLAERKVK